MGSFFAVVNGEAPGLPFFPCGLIHPYTDGMICHNKLFVCPLYRSRQLDFSGAVIPVYQSLRFLQTTIQIAAP